MTPWPTSEQYYFINKEFNEVLPFGLEQIPFGYEFKQMSGCTFNNINVNRNYMIKIISEIPIFDNVFQFDQIWPDKPSPIWANYNGNLFLQRCTFINCQHRSRSVISEGNVFNVNTNNIVNVNFESCFFKNCGNVEGSSVISIFNRQCSLSMINCSIIFDNGTSSPFICISKCVVNIFDNCRFEKCGKIYISDTSRDCSLQFTNNIVENVFKSFIETNIITSIDIKDNIFKNIKYDSDFYFLNLSCLDKIELINNEFSNFAIGSNNKCYGGGLSSIFMFENEQNSSLIFNNCTFIDIENNRNKSPYSNGGSFQSEYSSESNFSITFEQCKFIRNKSQFGKGGAISISSFKNITITECIFKDNKSYQNGGAIYIYSNQTNQFNMVSIIQCEFNGNNGEDGSSIYLNEDKSDKNICVEIQMNIFSNNGENKKKFAIVIYCKELDFEDNIIYYSNINNSSSALYVNNLERIYINNCNFSYCVTSNKGVIEMENPRLKTTTTISKCIFLNCLSRQYIIELIYGITEIDSCSFLFDNENSSCGGISFGESVFSIQNSKFVKTNSYGAIIYNQQPNSVEQVSIVGCTFDECYGLNMRSLQVYVYSSMKFQNNIFQNMKHLGSNNYIAVINCNQMVSNFILENITFINNDCNSEYCGGIGFWIAGVYRITFDRCKFINNVALKSDEPRSIHPVGIDDYYSGDGGAIQYGYKHSLKSIDLTFTGCLFSRNKAVRNGGAIAIQTQKEVEIINCTFEENVANYQPQSLELLYENHYDKKNEGRGGAIYINPSFTTTQGSFCLLSITIKDCIFKSNKAFDGYAIYIEGDDSETIFEFENNKFIDNCDESIHTVNKSVITSEVMNISKNKVIDSNHFEYSNQEINVTPFNYVNHFGDPIIFATCINNCKECNQFECILCEDGFYLNSDKICEKCNESCKTCHGPESNQCDSCNDGFYVHNNECKQCPIDCATCGFYNIHDEPACFTCAESYYAVFNYSGGGGFILCLPCNNEYQSNCKKCIAFDQCIVCNPGYYLEGTSCYECNSNCAACEDKYTCLSCKEGYYLNAVGECFACSSNCIKCNSFICNQCISGFFVEDGICYSCESNCLNCTGIGRCTNCENKFYINEEGRCSQCADVCSECTGPTPQDCISCINGYFFSQTNRNCFKCHESCSECTGPNEYDCLSCSNGYFMSHIFTGEDTEINICVKCEKGCSECISYTECITCKEGYRIIDDRGDKDCEQCEEGCNKCDSDSTKCTECSTNGFYVSETYTENEQIFLHCSKCPLNCKTCTFNDGELVCTSCFDGYYIDSSTNTCKECNSPCATCSSSSICLSCIQGHLQEGNLCNKQCSDNCLTCKETIDHCDSCHDQYVLNGTSCILCPEGCQMCEIYGNGTTCFRCLDGYYKDGNNCFKCPFPCSTCSRNNTYSGCYSCENGYYMSRIYSYPTPYGGGCKKCSDRVEHCVECFSDCDNDYLDSYIDCKIVNCTKCDEGYSVSDDFQKCEKIDCIENCLLCNEQNCTICNDGYTIFWDLVMNKFICVEFFLNTESESSESSFGITLTSEESSVIQSEELSETQSEEPSDIILTSEESSNIIITSGGSSNIETSNINGESETPTDVSSEESSNVYFETENGANEGKSVLLTNSNISPLKYSVSFPFSSINSNEFDSILLPTKEPKKKISKGALIGIVCGVIVLVAVAATAAVFIVRRGKRKDSVNERSRVLSKGQPDVSEITKNQDSDDIDMNFWL